MNDLHKKCEWKGVDYDFPVLEKDKNVNTGELSKIRNDWLDKLLLLSKLTDMNDDWYQKIQSFTQFLLEHQSEYKDNHVNIIGAWCIPEDPRMPSDARVDFLYMPTYIATAWLVLVKQKYTSISEQYSNYDTQLAKALDFCSGRNLSGHGYDATQELIIAVDYLSLGGVFKFIKQYPFVSPKFSRCIIKAKINISKRLELSIKNKKRDEVDWGGIGENKATKALLLLDGQL